MQEEEWRPVANFEGYCVSNLGRVRSERGEGRVLKYKDNGKGYLTVSLSKNNVVQTTYIHRLVAEAFIPNPDDKKCVDHIDRNKQNNVISNLRWATYSENSFNTKVRDDNTSGFKGVTFTKKSKINPWYVRTYKNGRFVYLGSFATKEEAAEAYRLYHTQ